MGETHLDLGDGAAGALDVDDEAAVLCSAVALEAYEQSRMQPMGVHGDVGDAGVGQELQGVHDQRPAADLDEGFGPLVGQGGQAGAQASGEDPGDGHACLYCCGPNFRRGPTHRRRMMITRQGDGVAALGTSGPRRR